MNESVIDNSVVLDSKNKSFKSKFSEFLNSNYMLAILSILAVFCWTIDFPFLSIGFFAVYEVCVFIFCYDNPKAFIFPTIVISYTVTSIYGLFNWIFYIACLVTFITTITVYIFKQKIKDKKQFKKGKFFWAFVLSGIGNCLAGIFAHWELLAFIVTVGMCFLVYGIYWFCLNFLKDYKKYFAYCLIFLTFVIMGELLINYIRSGDFLYALQHKVVRVGSGEINAAATFMLSGVCACFYLATQHKYDYWYLLLALGFDIGIFLTLSRIAIVIAAVLTVVYFFFVLKKSNNKKIILISLGLLILLAGIVCIVFSSKINDILSYYLRLGFKANGRNKLWPWMWNKFKQNPIFGIGFITREADVLAEVYPGMSNLGGFALVNAHNFFLHYLTCTGIVGTILNIPFYVKKYKETFTNFNKFKLFCLFNFIAIFIASLFDPSPNNSIFNIVIVLFLMALVEDDNTEKVEKLNSSNIKEDKKTI